MDPSCRPGCGTWDVSTGCPVATSTCAASTSHPPAPSGAAVYATCDWMQCPPSFLGHQQSRSNGVLEATQKASASAGSLVPVSGPSCQGTWPYAPGDAGTSIRTPGGHGCQVPVPLDYFAGSCRATPWSPRQAPPGWTRLGPGSAPVQQQAQRLQQCQERQRVQLRALEELAQQLCRESLVAQACGGLLHRVSAACPAHTACVFSFKLQHNI